MMRRNPSPARRLMTRRMLVCGAGGLTLTASAGLLSRTTLAPRPADPSGTQFGVNCFDLFYRPFYRPGPYDPAPRLRQLRDAGITLVRFAASPFWPKEWDLYFRSQDAYLTQLDRVFAAGEALGMRFVPSVIWAAAGVSDRMGEPFSAWSDPRSRSRRFMEDYAGLVISRYRDSPALFMWEFGNELNSFADMPNSELWAPKLNLKAGTPAKRTAADRISGRAVMDTYDSFTRIARQNGSRHPIGSGGNLPRNDQMQDSLGKAGLDSPAQFAQALTQCLANDLDILTIHLYPKARHPRFRKEGASYGEILSIAREVADSRKARLFVSEFGVERSGDDARDRADYAELVAALKAAKVDYAALWNYDFAYQKGWNVTFDNDRSWMLDIIATPNA